MPLSGEIGLIARLLKNENLQMVRCFSLIAAVILIGMARNTLQLCLKCNSAVHKTAPGSIVSAGLELQVKLFEPAQYETGRVGEVILAVSQADGWHSGQKSLERDSRLKPR